MHNRYLKKLICVSIILVIVFVLFSSTAYAEFPPLTTAGRRLGSWILSAITAANIALTSTVSGSQGADIINFLGDPFDVTYSYTEMWDDKPTIQIWDDYVTIDGVTYTDIWISNEAAQKFKTDGLDFATAYSIASNTNGTFASGTGSLSGLPVFDVNNQLRTQNYSVDKDTTNVMGGFSQSFTKGSSSLSSTLNWAGGTRSGNLGSKEVIPEYVWFQADNRNVAKFKQTATIDRSYYGLPETNVTWTGNDMVGVYTAGSFDFDYVAENIDSTPLGPDEGIMIRVPSDTPGLQQYITNNYYMTDPYEIDPSLDPDILGKLDDLIDIIAPILINLDNDDITFVENHDAPIPPVQDTLLPDTWWSTLEHKFDEVIQNIQQIPSNIPSYNTILQSISQTISSINDKLGDLVDDIIQGIEEGPIKLVDKVIDALKNVFATILATLASALGIWHYVVEWIASISAPFTFIFGIMQGTSYNLVLPIYALVAGTIVIAVYRRFGQ